MHSETSTKPAEIQLPLSPVCLTLHVSCLPTDDSHEISFFIWLVGMGTKFENIMHYIESIHKGAILVVKCIDQKKIIWPLDVYYVWFDFLRPSQFFSVMSGWIFLS